MIPSRFPHRTGGLGRPSGWLCLAALLALFVAGCRTAPTNSLGTHNSAKWTNAIAAFQAADATNPPPRGCIIFTGSSYIRRWTNLVADFPGLPVVNRGFGGCQLADVYNYADRLIIPHHPRQVVVYAGGNDLNAKKDPQVVFGDFVALMTRLRTGLPDAKLAFISCPPSPRRWAQAENTRKLNGLIANYCRRHDIDFINTFPLMLGPDGLPRPDIYVEDQLHMNQKGYAIWREAVAPHLK